MSKDKLRVGVIGVGSMGENHVRVYKHLPEVELVGVFDVNHARAAQVAERYKTVVFRNIDQLLDSGINAVSIAVPASKHLETVSRCARSGCHILLEKPLADNLENAKKIIWECEFNDVRLMVGHIERFNPVIQTLKTHLVVDKILSINITRVGPKPPRIKDVGVTKDMGIHDIDLLRYLTGKEIVSAFAFVAPENGTEDISMTSFRLEDNILAHLTVNWITPYKVRKIQIYGSSEFLEADLSNGMAHKYIYNHRENNYIISELPVASEEPLYNEIRTFISCLRFGRDFPISLNDAYRALEIAELCRINSGKLFSCIPF